MAIDYTSFRTDGSTPDDKDKNFDRKWWLAKKSDRPDIIGRVVEFIAKNDSLRQQQYQISARLYGNAQLVGVSGYSAPTKRSQNAIKDRLTYNVCQSAVDTVVAKMSKNKPMPMFLTSGGDYKLQRKAKKLDKFVQGIFYENRADEMGPMAFRDAGVLGDGIIHVFNHFGRVKWERVIPSELYVDWVDAFYGEPTQLYRVKNVDRDILIETFPQWENKIKQAMGAQIILHGDAQNIADQVTVIEAWHLPSGPDAKDGMHSICIANQELFMEKWDRPNFPFAKLPWSKRMYGYWSQGGVEQIQNIQLELNKILWIIQRSIHLAGSFKVLIENTSKIVKDYLNNDIGAIITYTNNPPQFVTPPAVPIELYQQVANLKEAAFEQFGVSQLSATSKKPEGLDSGKALREYNDIESDRFTVLGQNYENFRLELARLSIQEAKCIYEAEGEYEVTTPDSKFIESINWDDVNMEDDEYYMKMFPISSLPQEPAGRLETIQNYIQAGFLSPRQGRRLLDFPDLEQIESLANSVEDYLHKILEKIVDEGEYTPPEPFDDLNLANELALEYYSQGKCNGLEEEKLEMLRTFISQVQLLQQKALPPAPMPMDQGAPQAMPEQAPVSDLIPNIPGVA